MTSLWVDLSEHNTVTDWDKLATEVDGVILRVQDGSHKDSKYLEYAAACKQRNIPFGTYAFFRGNGLGEAEQAYTLMDKATKFVVVDIETVCCKNPADVPKAGQVFVDFFKNKGYHTGLYTYQDFYQTYKLASMEVDFHWIAAYGVDDGKPHSAPTISDDLWQFTSKGQLAGVQGYVDESQVMNHLPVSFFTGVPQPIGTVTVTAGLLNVRKAPDVNSALVGKPLKKGTSWKCWGSRFGWFNVGCGWVSGAYVKFTPAGK